MIGWLVADILTHLAIDRIAHSQRIDLRIATYRRAVEQAQAEGRTLVVVGAPTGGNTRGHYGCGNVCIDLDGCRACDAPSRDLQKPNSIPVANNTAVVFVSYTLECCPDIDAAWAEILRAAGDIDHVHLLTVQPWAIWTNAFYPGIRWVVTGAPKSDGSLPYRPAHFNREIVPR